MLADGYQIESPLSRAQLWNQLIALENIAHWSALADCISTESQYLEPTSSYICRHHNGETDCDASVQVVDFEIGECIALRTSTVMADVSERLELNDHWGGSLVTYSADATSSGFGPTTSTWLRLHVQHVATKLEQFANNDLM
jgi:hypothetical protein